MSGWRYEMTQAEELLDTLSETSDTEESHIVIGSDRIITVPDALKRIAVQYDHNVETATFDCPRYWDGRDLSEMDILINWIRSDGYNDKYQAESVTIDESDESIIHFDWTIERDITEVSGNLTFSVCGRKLNDNGVEMQHWNSEINKDLYVSEGINCDDVNENNGNYTLY